MTSAFGGQRSIQLSYGCLSRGDRAKGAGLPEAKAVAGPMDVATLSAGIGLTLGLVWLAVVDWRELRLPDALTLPLVALGVAWLGGAEGRWWDSLIGAAVGYLALVAVEVGYRMLRGRDGIGRGDAKLLAAGGAWCGWMGLPFIVMIGSLFGIVAAVLFRGGTVRDGGRIPLGTFLCAGVAIVFWAQAWA